MARDGPANPHQHCEHDVADRHQKYFREGRARGVLRERIFAVLAGINGWSFLRNARTAASLALMLLLAAPKVIAGRDAIVTVGGQNFHMERLGKGGPNVIFEAGLGNDTTTWKLVAAPIAAFARPVLYDRPGLGQSQPMITKKSMVTADEVVTNLRKLLEAADIHPPYILVGHSLGGLYVQMFAKKYPRQVSAVVLLDSSSADAPSELKTAAHLEPGTAAFLEEEGIAESNKQVKSAGPFPDVPVVVIAATDHGPLFKSWEPTLMHLQQQLAALSPQGTLVVADGSGHDIQLDRPNMVIDAVRRMANAKNYSPPHP
jgi:pimeloyl-ACP methyl ester carboxylesterase